MHRSTWLEHRFTKFSDITQCNGHYLEWHKDGNRFTKYTKYNIHNTQIQRKLKKNPAAMPQIPTVGRAFYPALLNRHQTEPQWRHGGTTPGDTLQGVQPE